jgi:hypothetical protein
MANRVSLHQVVTSGSNVTFYFSTTETISNCTLRLELAKSVNWNASVNDRINILIKITQTIPAGENTLSWTGEKASDFSTFNGAYYRIYINDEFEKSGSVPAFT